MKTLKRLDLKKCTELKSAEMKEILGGASTAVGLTCAPQASNCGGRCGVNGSGTCKNVPEVFNLCGCYGG